MSRPFCNNLRQNDRVLDTVSGRQGKVAWAPRNETSRRTYVIFDGTSTPRPCDVMQLRFIVDGHPEDVPPVDGEPPAECPVNPPPERTAKNGHGDALSSLRAELEKNKAELLQIEERHKLLRFQNEQLEKAIKILTEPIAQ